MILPPTVAAYCEELNTHLRALLGADLVGLYLHGSAAMGGWHEALSDVDCLAVVDRPLTSADKAAITASVASLDSPGTGLELSIVRMSAFEPLLVRPPFELHIATGAKSKVVDGAGHRGDSDLVMHFAVCRARGVAISGPAPQEHFPEVSRSVLLRAFDAELAWGLANAPGRYAVLNACRAWAFAEEGELLSKIEGGEWAAKRDFEPEPIRAALAAQRGEQVPLGKEATERFVAHVRAVLQSAVKVADGA